MTDALLDPWRDAARIADRLKRGEGKLVVFLGAESWCHKCLEIKPSVERLATGQGSADTTWLWLDLEDHAELLDDFIPDDLPWLVMYQRGRLSRSHHVPIPQDGQTLEQVLNAVVGPAIDSADPGIRQRLLLADWAA